MVAMRTPRHALNRPKLRPTKVSHDVRHAVGVAATAAVVRHMRVTTSAQSSRPRLRRKRRRRARALSPSMPICARASSRSCPTTTTTVLSATIPSPKSRRCGRARAAMPCCTSRAPANGRNAASSRWKSAMRCTKTPRSATQKDPGAARGASTHARPFPRRTRAGAGASTIPAPTPCPTRVAGRVRAPVRGTAARPACAIPARVRGALRR